MVSAKLYGNTLGMKNKTLFLICLSAVVLAAGFVTGCATDNYHKGAGTASALTHSSELIMKATARLMIPWRH